MTLSSLRELNPVLQENPPPVASVSAIRDRLRRDLRFLTFYLSPNMVNFRESAEWFQENFGLEASESMALANDLLRADLWVREKDGKIHTREPRLSLADRGERLTATEAVTMITQLVGHVTDKNDLCTTLTHTVVTSHELKREFLARVQLAVRNLLDRSRAAPGETTFSWSFLYLDTIKALMQEDLL